MNRCKLLPALCLLWWGAALSLIAQETNASMTLQQLREQLAAHLAQPKFSGALWGVKIISLASGQTVFADHADRLMSPASNSKLYTGALSLDRLGGDYRIETPIYAAGKISHGGTLHGDLIVVGHGDPSWNERLRGTNFWAILEPFATILTSAGVRRVDGDLIADATFFAGQPTGSGWLIDDLRHGNAGMISALTLDDNLAQVRIEPGPKIGAGCRVTLLQPGTGLIFSNQAFTVAANLTPHIELFHPPDADARMLYVLGQLPLNGGCEILDVAVPQPADWFANALKQALARHRIVISGRARSVAWPHGVPGDQAGTEMERWDGRAALRLGVVTSPPVRELVLNFMKPSQNLEADLLLAQVGEKLRPVDAPTWESVSESGLSIMQDFLAETGVAPGDVRFDEGSGLSRENLTTASATVALLRFMAKHRESENFLASLPVAGVDGTLQDRFRNTAAAGNVRAKTGTLHWASALSGYVTTSVGERLAFCVMLNRFSPGSGHNAYEEIDPIVVQLANFKGHSE
jgi:D-alanyl-D-alanine carboxypeptidase/D-alanyl-D-alanine-endopeptidase (penicillin-binding protein 4)